MTAKENVHLHEINKFGSMAERWWDLQGEFKTLHDVNPLRLQFIQSFVEISGKRMVDVGCGGGILTEGLAKAGADALGIDLSEELIDVADLHGLESGVNAHYQKISVETLAEQQPDSFDHVTCMEMLEHVPDAGSVISACAQLPKGTHDYKTFIKPSELCQSARKAGLELQGIVGIEYNPFNKQFRLGNDIDVNYIAAFKRTV